MFKPHFQRFYHKDESYFITSNTEIKFPYFEDYGCCQILLENMRFAKQLLNFEIYSFIIMPGHFHWIICPRGEKNISQIMHFVKRNTSRHINDKYRNIPNTVDKVYKPCPQYCDVIRLHEEKINSIKISINQRFQWQSSFHDRLIRDENEFDSYLSYINENNLAE